MSAALSDLQVASALAEMVYRRDPQDQAIDLPNIADASDLPGVVVSPPLKRVGNFFYDDATGFVGRVVQANGQVYVVFRGTDAAVLSLSTMIAAVAHLNDPSVIDANDINKADIPLGQGTMSATQFDDALALTRAAQQAAGSRPVVVVGQSLGAGLAGLVSAALDLKSYLFDPAPFAADLPYVAAKLAWTDNGIPLDDLKTLDAANSSVDDVTSALRSSGDGDLRNRLTAYFTAHFPQFLDKVDAIVKSRRAYLNNIQNLSQNATGVRLEGELLTSGLTALGLSIASTPFNIAVRDISVGTGDSVSLHSPALINLVLRTEGSKQQFGTLLKKDATLRAAFLDQPGDDIGPIAGPLDHGREDPSGSSSKVGASGPNSTIVYDALWKTVGDPALFYNQFYTRFSSWLASGAVAQGLSPISDQFSIHSAVVKLGLGVVRDAISRDAASTPSTIISEAGLHVFGPSDDGGSVPTSPTQGYVRIDLSDIKATDRRLKDPKTGQPFGMRDINVVLVKAVDNELNAVSSNTRTILADDILSRVSPLSADATPGNAESGEFKLKSGRWKTLIVQSGPGSLNDLSIADALGASVIIGGDKGDVIKGSKGDDYIIGGKGDDTFIGSLGHDLIIGGGGSNTYVAQASKKSEDGTVFLGDFNGTNKAVYKDGFAKDTFSLSEDFIVPKARNLGVRMSGVDVTDGKRTDTLLNSQEIDFSGGKETVIVDKSMVDKKNKSPLTVDGGASDGGKNTLDLRPLGKITFANGQIDGTTPVYKNFTVLKADPGDVDITLGGSGDASLQELDLGDGNDTVTSTVDGLTVNLGNGNDTLLHAGAGSVINVGQGNDTFEVSDKVLLTGVKHTDKIMVGDHVLTGGIEYEGQESPWVLGADGTRYGLDVAGELQVRDTNDDTLFVANDVTGPGTFQTDTAGILLEQVSLKAYRILDPNLPNVNWQQTQFEFVNALSKAYDHLAIYNNVDPLVLDLTGAGLNLRGVSTVAPSFDLKGDGFAVRTGWVAPNVGILVLDKNGDGEVNNIGELFGGEASTAGLSAVGFAQLAKYDANLDGVIDASDPIYSQLRIWADANGNGVADPGELLTLQQAGIASIDLAAAAQTGDFVAGNQVLATGSFTRTDGSTGEVADVSFHTDDFHTTFLGDSSVGAAATALPDLKGYGTLSDLRVAMSHDPALADPTHRTPRLIDVVTATLPSLNAIDLSTLRQRILPILASWARASEIINTDGTLASVPPAGHADLPVLETTSESGIAVSDFAFAVTDAQGSFWKLASGGAVKDAQGNAILRPTLAQVLAQLPASGGQWTTFSGAELDFLERYIGDKLPLGSVPENPGAALTALSPTLNLLGNALNEIAVSLAMQGPLAPYFPGIQYDTATNKFIATTSGQLTPMYEAIFRAAPPDAAGTTAWLQQWKPILDVVMGDFDRGGDLKLTYGYRFVNLVAGYEAVPLPIDIKTAASVLGIPPDKIVTGGATLTGDNNGDLYYVSGANQTVVGGLGPDNIIVGKNFGNDTISDDKPFASNNVPENTLRFASLKSTDVTATRNGDNLILTETDTGQSLTITHELIGSFPTPFAGNINDVWGVQEITFADGVVWQIPDIARALAPNVNGVNGTLIGTGAMDVLDGGRGNHFLSGGNGGDIYLYDRGDGNDTIDVARTDVFDTAQTYIDFGPALTQDDLVFSRDGNSSDLLITVKNDPADSLKVLGQFAATFTGVFGTAFLDQVQVFRSADGTFLSWQDVESTLIAQAEATPGAELDGFAGVDNTLDPGVGGNRFMSGGNNNDTYVFGLGYGNDTIKGGHDNILAGGNQTVLFNPGVDPSQLQVVRNAGSGDVTLVLSDGSTLALENQFVNVSFLNIWPDRINHFQFQDAAHTLWGVDDIMNKALAAQEAVPGGAIYGFQRGDTIDPGLGGNHFMSGKGGPDVYIFGQGYGHDTILEDAGLFPSTGVTVLFKPGVDPATVRLERDGASNDLKLFLADGSELDIEGQFDPTRTIGPHFLDRVWNFQFQDASQTLWTYQDVMQKLLAQEEAVAASTVYDFAFGGSSLAPGGGHTLDGFAGNETLAGAQASFTTFVFGRGYGHEVVDGGQDTDPFLANFNTLQFGAGITAGEITFARHGADVTLGVAGTSDTVTLRNEFDGISGTTGANPVMAFDFADGTSWDLATFKQNLFAYEEATPGAEVIGYSGNAATSGEQANQTVIGIGGNDTLFGVAGDTLIGGPNGNNTLYGGPGMTLLGGGGDNNRYVLSGGGHVTIDPEGGNGTVQMAGDAAGDAIFEAAGNDLTIRFLSTGDSLTLKNDFRRDLFGDLGSRIGTVKLGDGSTLNLNQPLTFTWIGSAGDTTLVGSDLGANVFELAAGGDTAIGGSGANAFLYGKGDGHATIVPGGVNTLEMAGATASDAYLQADSAGDLTLRLLGDPADSVTIDGDLTTRGFVTQSKIGTVAFGDGTTLDLSHGPTFTWFGTASETTLTGSAFGTNIFDLGPGGDTVIPGFFTDIYKFDKGDGHVTIVDPPGGTIEMASDIAASDVTLVSSNNGDLAVELLDDPADRITIKGDLFGNGFQHGSAIGEIAFAGGAVLNLNGPLTFTWTATSTNTTLVGSNFGSNLFNLAPGGDTVIAGSGKNTYVFDKGDGGAVVLGPTAGDVIQMASDIARSDVILQADDAGDLIVKLLDTGETLTAQGDLSGIGFSGSSKVGAITFGDGSTLNLSLDPTFTWIGTAGNTTLVGSRFGANVFDLGPGGDTVTGGISGANLYAFDKGDGQASINNFHTGTGTSALVLGSDVAPGDVALSNPSGTHDLVLSIAGTNDQVTVQNEFAPVAATGSYRVDDIRFAGGTDWNFATILSKLGVPPPGVEILTASASALVGVAGDQTLISVGTNDTLISGPGDETLDAQGSQSTLVATSGNDILIGEQSSDVLEAGSGSDTLIGSSNSFRDTFFGGSGNDSLVALGSGSDFMRGGTGASELLHDSGGGSSTLIAGSGTDTLIADNGFNTVQGGAGADFLASSGGFNALVAGAGGGTLIGTGGFNTFIGGGGNEVMLSIGRFDTPFDDGSSADFMIAGTGNDTMVALGGFNTLVGGIGNDTLAALPQLNGDVEGSGHDTLIAGAGTNTLLAVGASDILIGGSGSDVLNASGANDTVIGGAGSNTILVNGGTDTFFGHGGNDTFVVVSAPLASGATQPQNLIADFDPSNPNQKIDLSNFAAIASLADLSFATVSFGAQSYLQVNLGGGQALMLAGVTAGQLSAGNFVFASHAPPPPPTAPTLTVAPAAGNAASAIRLAIAAALTDVGAAETLSVTVAGLPAGATLSAGTRNSDGSWTLTPAELAGLTLATPLNTSGNFALSVTATASDAAGQASTSRSLALAVAAVASPPALTVAPAEGFGGLAIPLAIAAATTDPDGQESLSVTIAGLPSGVTLSAGTPNADGSWTLTAAQLAGLTVIAPKGVAGSFALTVTATSTEPSDGSQASSSANLSLVLEPIETTSADGAVLQAGAGGWTLIGGGANDTLIGASGSDTLIGAGASDTLIAGSGGDTLIGGGNGDTLAGNVDGDTLISTGSQTVAFFGLDNLTVDLAAGRAMINGSSTPEILFAIANVAMSGSNDTVIAGSGAATLSSSGSSNTLIVGSGRDVLSSSGTGDILIGGTGADTLSSSGSSNTLIAGSAPDVLLSSGSGDTLLGNADGSTLIGSAGTGVIAAYGLDNVAINLAAGSAAVNGSSGPSDTLIGIAAAAAYGRNDTLIAANAADTLIGDAAGSTLIGGYAAYTLDGVTVNLASGTAALNGKASSTPAQADTLIGITSATVTGGSDTLIAGGAAAFLASSGFFNTLVSGSSADTLLSVGSGDTLVGNAFGSTLDGATGAGAVAAYSLDNLAVNLGAGTAGINGSGVSDTLLGIAAAAAFGHGDTLIGGPSTSAQGVSTLISGAGGNTLVAGSGQTVASYGLDNATVDLGAGTARANGASAADTLVGISAAAVSGSNDTLIAGGAAGEMLLANGSGDSLVGNGGGDTLDGSGGSGAVAVYGAANATVDLATGKAGVNGGASSDTLTGIAAAAVSGSGDTLIGDNNGDTLAASGSGDTALGGTGDDTLLINGGTDTFFGGGGSDRFVVLGAATASGLDQPQNLIGDFDPLNDTIDLTHLGALTSFADLGFGTVSFGALSYLQVGLGAGQALTLAGVTSGQLSADNFLFHPVAAPTLSVAPASGEAATAIPLAISSALVDIGTAETLSVTIAGLPPGALLSAGTQNDDGSWTLTAAQLAGLTLTTPFSSFGNFALSVAATATALDGVTAASTSGTINLSIIARPSPPLLAVQNAKGDPGSAIPLVINTAVLDHDRQESLSLTIKGLPAGTTLSAGSENPDGSWTLTPAQLSGLTLTAPARLAGIFEPVVTATATLTSDGLEAQTSANFALLLGTDGRVLSTAADGIVLQGGAGGETLIATGARDTLIAGSGADTLVSAGVDDTLFGNAMGSTLDGTVGTGTVAAYTISNVTLDLGTGTARVNGSSTSDTLAGIGIAVALGSNDTLIGGSAMDTLISDGSGNTLVAGPGSTVADYAVDDVTVNLAAGTASVNGASVRDTLVGGFTVAVVAGANATLIAGGGADTLTALGNADTLIGGPGNDILIGGAGDSLSGSSNEMLISGSANDTLIGGSGLDTVSFGATQSSAASFGFSGGHWTVTVGAHTDTLVGVERVRFADKTVLLVDQLGAGAGGFQSVQSAIDAAAGGETILVAPGTYTESTIPAPFSSTPGGFFINKPNLTLQGVKADGSLIAGAADARAFGPTIISGAETDFGSNLFIGPNASGATLRGLHLAAGANTTNKLVEFWANNVTLENNFIDTFHQGVDTGAAAVYINVSGPPITQYLITGNILNEGIYVANGVGTAGQGIGARQVISDNTFGGSFDDASGNGRLDMVAVQGQIPGIAWQPDPAQVPTIEGNSRIDNAAPFIFRMTEANPALFPTASQVATILAQNTDASTSYAYVLNPDATLHLVDRNNGAGDFKALYIANNIETLNLGLSGPNAVYSGPRDTMDPGDTVIVQSVGPTTDDIIVNDLTVDATATSAALDLRLAGGVTQLTLGDYDQARHLGANVTVTGNTLGDVFVANSGSDTLIGGGGYDTYKFGTTFGQTTINNLASDGVASAQGEIDFGSGVSDNQLWFEQKGNDLQIDLMGTSDHLTVSGWYGGNVRAQVQSIDLADGSKLDAQLQQLVGAMATYSANNPGFDPTAVSQAPNDPNLQNAIAAAWHH